MVIVVQCAEGKVATRAEGTPTPRLPLEISFSLFQLESVSPVYSAMREILYMEQRTVSLSLLVCFVVTGRKKHQWQMDFRIC